MNIQAAIRAQEHKPTMDLMAEELFRAEALLEQCPQGHPEYGSLIRALTLFYDQLNRLPGNGILS